MFFISKETQQINSEIKDKELRVISADGEQLGIMSASDALHIAETKGLDLVKIAPMSRLSVKRKIAKIKSRLKLKKFVFPLLLTSATSTLKLIRLKSFSHQAIK